MTWSKENITSVGNSRLSFYIQWREQYECPKQNADSWMLKLFWSHDSLVWKPLWNRTIAQMTLEQWEPVLVKIPTMVKAEPAAFKWTLKYTGCESKLNLAFDDITFPTVAPSADTISLGKAPPAPLPSPAVCSALCTQRCAVRHSQMHQQVFAI